MKKIIALFVIGTAVIVISRIATAKSKKQEIINWIYTIPDSGKSELIEIVNKMSDDEIASMHEFIFKYIVNQQKPPAGSSLYGKIEIISGKYNIFT